MTASKRCEEICGQNLPFDAFIPALQRKTIQEKRKLFCSSSGSVGFCLTYRISGDQNVKLRPKRGSNHVWKTNIKGFLSKNKSCVFTRFTTSPFMMYYRCVSCLVSFSFPQNRISFHSIKAPKLHNMVFMWGGCLGTESSQTACKTFSGMEACIGRGAAGLLSLKRSVYQEEALNLTSARPSFSLQERL